MAHSADWLALDCILTDKVARADVAYLVGETKDNARSVLERGADLWKRGLIPKLAIQKGGDGFGYCGFGYSVEILKRLGIPEQDIVGIEYRFEFGERVINTLTELITAVRFAKKQEWRRLCLVAPEFHMRRSFLTAVTVIDREYPSLKVYSRVGTPLPEDEMVVHSQGTLTGTRLELATAEDKRIVNYQKSGSPYLLVSVQRALVYLEQRDKT